MKETNPSLLLLDEDPASLQLLSKVLESEGFSITIAKSLEEALSSGKLPPPEAILCDLPQNENDAEKFQLEIRQRLPETKFLGLVTEPFPSEQIVDQPKSIYEASKKFADAVLTKPIDKKELRSVLQANLSSIPKSKKTSDSSPKYLVFAVDERLDHLRRLQTHFNSSPELKECALETFSDSIEALGLLTDMFIDYMEDPAVLILNVKMPRMDGFEFLSHLRKLKRWDDLPVILTADSVTKEIVVKALELGCNEFLVKPPDKNSLVKKVLKVLEKKSGRPPERIDHSL